MTIARLNKLELPKEGLAGDFNDKDKKEVLIARPNFPIAKSLAPELLKKDSAISTPADLTAEDLADIDSKEQELIPVTIESAPVQKEEVKTLPPPPTKSAVSSSFNVEDAEMPIEFSSEAWLKIKTWVEMTTNEISGLGLVERTKDGFSVSEVFLLKQKNTSGFTDIDDEDQLNLFAKIIEEDEANNTNKADQLRFWWHSHANMTTFWSGQDESCIQAKLSHATWWLSAVFNRKGEVKTRLDIKEPRMRFDNLECQHEEFIPKEIKEKCRLEFNEKVTESNTYYNNRSNAERNFYDFARRDSRDQGKSPYQLPIWDRSNEPIHVSYQPGMAFVDPHDKKVSHASPSYFKKAYSNYISLIEKEIHKDYPKSNPTGFCTFFRSFSNKLVMNICGSIAKGDLLIAVWPGEPSFRKMAIITGVYNDLTGVSVNVRVTAPEDRMAVCAISSNPQIDLLKIPGDPRLCIGLLYSDLVLEEEKGGREKKSKKEKEYFDYSRQAQVNRRLNSEMPAEDMRDTLSSMVSIASESELSLILQSACDIILSDPEAEEVDKEEAGMLPLTADSIIREDLERWISDETDDDYLELIVGAAFDILIENRKFFCTTCLTPVPLGEGPVYKCICCGTNLTVRNND
jgi:hypothetical protein